MVLESDRPGPGLGLGFPGPPGTYSEAERGEGPGGSLTTDSRVGPNSGVLPALSTAAVLNLACIQ